MGRRIAQTGFAIAMVNLLIGFAIRVHFHGDASLGYVPNGHYYFGVPGNYTEVSPALWDFSFRQIPILIATQAMGLLCAMYLWPPRWWPNSN
jgi:hypothetical protein